MAPLRTFARTDRRKRILLATTVALGYLLGVAATFAYTFLVMPVDGMRGFPLFVVTLPSSLLTFPLALQLEAWDGMAGVTMVAVSALVQAVVLWRLVRGRRVVS